MIAGADVARALAERAEALGRRLLDKVEANLSGGVIAARTGALKASVVAEFAADADEVAMSITSGGVPYAAIQEYGGTTPAHDILPVKAKALAFAGGFAARVHHPGSVVPARAPFGSALDDLSAEIGPGLKQAVRDALGA